MLEHHRGIEPRRSGLQPELLSRAVVRGRAPRNRTPQPTEFGAQCAYPERAPCPVGLRQRPLRSPGSPLLRRGDLGKTLARGASPSPNLSLGALAGNRTRPSAVPERRPVHVDLEGIREASWVAPCGPPFGLYFDRAPGLSASWIISGPGGTCCQRGEATAPPAEPQARGTRNLLGANQVLFPLSYQARTRGPHRVRTCGLLRVEQAIFQLI